MPNSFTGIGGWNAKDISAIHIDDRLVNIGNNVSVTGVTTGFDVVFGENNTVSSFSAGWTNDDNETFSSDSHQFVFGTYNTAFGNYQFIVGSGNSNIFDETADWYDCISNTTIGYGNNISNSYFTYAFGNGNIISANKNPQDDTYYNGSEANYIFGNSNELKNGSYNNFIFGRKNAIDFAKNSFILGNNNSVTFTGTPLPEYTGYSGDINHVLMYGNNNTIHYYSYYGSIIGRENVFDEIDESVIIGNENELNVIADSFVKGWSNNIKYGVQNVIFGDGNSSMADIDRNIYIFGDMNSFSGDTQIIFGHANNISGEYIVAFGTKLSAKNCQNIFGLYNDYTYTSSRKILYDFNTATSAKEIPADSGVIFEIGNGRLNGYYYENGRKINDEWHYYFDVNDNPIDEMDEANIIRSNAMIVSADGTVSSTKLATSGIVDVESSITALQSQLGNIETALNAIINGSNS